MKTFLLWKNIIKRTAKIIFICAIFVALNSLEQSTSMNTTKIIPGNYRTLVTFVINRLEKYSPWGDTAEYTLTKSHSRATFVTFRSYGWPIWIYITENIRGRNLFHALFAAYFLVGNPPWSNIFGDTPVINRTSAICVWNHSLPAASVYIICAMYIY